MPTIVHEMVHQVSIVRGHERAFVDRFGSFLEEGITEHLALKTLGPKAEAKVYAESVRFIRELEDAGISVELVERAYLDGEIDALESAIRQAFGGDEARTQEFLRRLRAIGRNAENTEAQIEATVMLAVAAE